MGNIRAYLLRRRELCAYVIAGVIVTGVNYTIYSILDGLLWSGYQRQQYFQPGQSPCL